MFIEFIEYIADNPQESEVLSRAVSILVTDIRSVTDVEVMLGYKKQKMSKIIFKDNSYLLALSEYSDTVSKIELALLKIRVGETEQLT